MEELRELTYSHQQSHQQARLNQHKQITKKKYGGRTCPSVDCHPIAAARFEGFLTLVPSHDPTAGAYQVNKISYG